MIKPFVTVVIINYNYGRWVADAINSALNSDYERKRVVVIDDGSTDNSWEQIVDLLRLPSREHNKLIRGETRVESYGATVTNGGPARAFNLGMVPFVDKTDCFINLDSDDYFYPDRITKLVDEWTKAPESIGAVYSDYHIEGPDGIKITEYKQPFDRDILFSGNCIVHSSCLTSAKVMKQIGFYDENIYGPHDYDLWLRMSQSHLLVHLPEPTMLVRQTGINMSNLGVGTSHERWNENMRKVWAKWKQL